LRTVLFIKFDDLNSAPRVIRSYSALVGNYNIITAGYSPIGKANEKFIDLSFLKTIKEEPITFHLKYPSLIRKIISFFINLIVLRKYSPSMYYEKLYWTSHKKGAYKSLERLSFDVIVAHGIDTLPISVKLSKQKRAKLVFNAHEYYPREFEENKEWVKTVQPFYNYLCKSYISKTDLFINVSENIRQEYLKNFNCDSIVINNAANYFDLTPLICKNKIRMIHHGAAIKSRNFHLMIDCVEQLDERFTLDLMIVPTDKEYYEELFKKLKGHPKIRIIEPVEFNMIVKHINQYDIGLYILPKSNFNNEMALPNKFFEFIQARLMLAISPNPEMARLIKEFNLGVIADDYTPSSLARRLNSLSFGEVTEFKENAHKASKVINAEVNAEVYARHINNLFKNQVQ